jgi:predicted RNA binding protein YcfA (HicA-like mRNA interferase family)
MGKLPLLKASELAKILDQIGFKLIRREGSHMFFKHPDGRSTVVPNHPGERIDRGLLTKIIKKDLRLGRREFLKIIKKR